MTNNKLRKSFLVFGAPAIGKAEMREVVDCLRSGWIGTGPKVTRFEDLFARYKGARYVAAVNSCTAGLHLSMLAAGLKPGSEVITSALTFCATVNAIIHAGLTPVLADVERGTMNMDPVAVEKRITRRTRALLVVHFAGRPCNMDALCRIARQHRLKIIEDCAHAIETEYHGKKAGTFGDFGCFSFYATKNLTTGEGGMVLARKATDAARIKMLALHGMTKDAWRRFSDAGYRHYFVEDCGYKYNMPDLAAAIGIHQLARLEKNWKRRRQIWQHYNNCLRALPLELPQAPEPGTRHAHHLYTIQVDRARCGLSRDVFLEAMTARRIGVGVHYLSIPEHPYYQKTFGWRPGDWPEAMRIGRRTVSLPLSARLTDRDVEDVVTAVGAILERAGRRARRTQTIHSAS